MSDPTTRTTAAPLPCHFSITDDGPGVVVMVCKTHNMPIVRDNGLTLDYAMALAYTHQQKVARHAV